jgi:6-phosphofructokinase 1
VLPKAAIVHGGGPTAVLNASLAGAIEAARGRFDALYAGDVNLLDIPRERVMRIAETPGSAIGTTRSAVSFRRDIDVLFYTGGNGSMRAALDLSSELRVIGIPKTIDNDLMVTDHTPGYASTARFFACAVRDAGVDNRSLPSPICILETLGRNTGWIVAATSLARHDPDDAPHLIYLPEQRVSLDQIAADTDGVYRRLGRCVIAVCEGQLDERGEPFGADLDRELASNLGHTLAKKLSAKLGLRARAEKPGLTGRSCRAVERDRREAFACGAAAVEAALTGESSVMVALRADGSTFLTPLDTVAGFERPFPVEWLENGFREWATALIGEVPSYHRL